MVAAVLERIIVQRAEALEVVIGEARQGARQSRRVSPKLRVLSAPYLAKYDREPRTVTDR
jgi:hypothetical protein